MELLSAGITCFMSYVHLAVGLCYLGIGKLTNRGVLLNVPTLSLQSVGMLSALKIVLDMIRWLV